MSVGCEGTEGPKGLAGVWIRRNVTVISKLAKLQGDVIFIYFQTIKSCMQVKSGKKQNKQKWLWRLLLGCFVRAIVWKSNPIPGKDTIALVG